MANKPETVFYMGSHTTPPCEENTYHMIFTKPLIMSGCQFKLLRENSLLSHKLKNIHARKDQPIADRVLYKYNTAKMKYIKNISAVLPQKFNKYLIKSGGYKKKNKIVCTKKGCFKRKIRRRAAKHTDCSFPKETTDRHKVDW